MRATINWHSRIKLKTTYLYTCSFGYVAVQHRRDGFGSKITTSVWYHWSGYVALGHCLKLLLYTEKTQFYLFESFNIISFKHDQTPWWISSGLWTGFKVWCLQLKQLTCYNGASDDCINVFVALGRIHNGFGYVWYYKMSNKMGRRFMAGRKGYVDSLVKHTRVAA